MSLRADQAGRVRRGMLVAAAIAATLGAHATMGGGRPGALTLMIAAGLVTLACCVPRRGLAWRRRGLLRLGVLGLLLQVALHFGITGIPWAFGMAVDAHDATSLRMSVFAHLVAGVSLAALCWLGERLLDAMVLLTRRVRRHLSDGLRAGGGGPWLPLADIGGWVGGPPAGRPISRGPPLTSG